MEAKPIIALTLICALWGMVLGFVHQLTEAKIKEAEQKEKEKQLLQIFPGCTFEEENGIYYCYSENQLVGKAVEVQVRGYGGPMKVLVGIRIDNTIQGVRVLSHNETRGIGTKATDPEYLAQYEGLAYEQLAFRPEGEVEAITGATITSTAILQAVREAMQHA